jgi:hypothetical protein
MIPDEAVAAAARAIDASKAEGCGCCAYPEFTPEDDKLADAMDINVRALLIAREALEAAAPYLMAAILEDCADTAETDELTSAAEVIYDLRRHAKDLRPHNA